VNGIFMFLFFKSFPSITVCCSSAKKLAKLALGLEGRGCFQVRLRKWLPDISRLCRGHLGHVIWGGSLRCLTSVRRLPSTLARMMFKRRDIPPVLLLLLLIILVMLTLSQILVVHNGRYGLLI